MHQEKGTKGIKVISQSYPIIITEKSKAGLTAHRTDRNAAKPREREREREREEERISQRFLSARDRSRIEPEQSPSRISLKLYHYGVAEAALVPTGNPNRSNYSNHAINYSN
jgi:hypothetical protein